MDLSMLDSLSLRIAPRSENHTLYSTAHIQRGLVLYDKNLELCEEAVGFGVPVLKLNLNTIFPSAVDLSYLSNGATQGLRARYRLNLEEKIQKKGDGLVHSPFVYTAKNLLAATIRRYTLFRGALTHTSSMLRTWLSLETSYQPSDIDTSLTLAYWADQATGKLKVSLEEFDRNLKGLTEVVIMNEQGAHTFDRYQDSEGTFLADNQIGCWDPVSAQQATFSSSTRGISFSLPQVPGTRLYRGRELVGSRLAWAGFGYSLSPTLEHFEYTLTLQKTP